MEICDRCGIAIGTDDIRYIVTISVAVDDGGGIGEPIGDIEIDEIIEQLKSIDPAELERGVHEEQSFILCLQCRQRFMSNPIGKSPFDPPEKDDEGYMH